MQPEMLILELKFKMCIFTWMRPVVHTTIRKSSMLIDADADCISKEKFHLQEGKFSHSSSVKAALAGLMHALV